MNGPRRVTRLSGPRTLSMGEDASRRRGVLALALCLWFGSTAALASSDGPSFSKGTVLVEGTHELGELMGTTKHIGCEGSFCLWLVAEELGPCFYGLCTNNFMVLSDLEGRFVGATHGIDSWSSSTPRFIDAEHVEVVTTSRNEPFTVVDDGLDPTRVSRQVLKVSPDGARFTPVPSPTPKWTKPGARRGDAPADPRPPKPRAVSDALLTRARTLCPKDARFNPVEYVCQGGTCMLLLSGGESPSDADAEEASPTSDGGLTGPFCGVLVKGEDVQSLALDESATGVEVTPTAYRFSGPVGARGSTEEMERLSRSRPGYMAFADTVGAVVDGIRPYPVRFARSAEAALALAPTVQAYTAAHVSWGLADWKDAADLASAWRLARVGEALALHVEVHDDKVVPLGTGTGLHSDHLEVSVPRPPGSPSPFFKVGVLLAAGGKVEARDWTGEANTVLPSIQGTWRKRPRGYEVTLTLPLADLGVPKPLVASGFLFAVSDADARGKQETLMGHGGVLHFWTEYPPSIAEYRRHGSMD